MSMAGGTGYGLELMGGTMGGIGDILQAANYHRPRLKPATGMELRLRQLAQDQLLGGGQETLGGTALYNQLAPILLGQLPGMHYVPGDSGGGGGMGGGTGAGSNLSSYQQQLQDLQQAQQRQAQLTSLKAQRKGAKGPAKHQFQQQIKALKKTIKSSPTTAQEERQAYMAGAQPGSFDIRQGPAPSGQTSLGDINSLLGMLGHGPDLSSIYQGAGGY